MMSDNATPRRPEPRHFRPQQWRFGIAAVLMTVTLAATAWMAPVSLLGTVPLFAIVLAVAAFGNPGVILSEEGIAWYALRSGWRFRKIPWQAVLEAKRSFLGLLGPVRLVVESGRYEVLVWGTPRPGRNLDVEIWTNALVGGEELLQALRDWLRARGRVSAPA